MSITRKAVALTGLLLASAIVLTGCATTSGNSNAGETITVVSDRSDFHLKPIFAAFEEQTGIKVNAVFVEEGLPARVTSGADKADLVITKDLPVLTTLKDQGFTQPIEKSKEVNEMLADPKTQLFVDPQKEYVATSYRARAIVYNKSKVDVNSLTGYDDLVSPQYKGKVCTRPLTHDYNISLLSQIIADKGQAYAADWAAKLKANLATDPTGNDRQQAKLVSEGVCDIALMNTYYYGLLLTNNEQRPIASATQLEFPNQAGKGSYVLYSGLSLLKTSKHVDAATKLIDYMLGTIGQNHISQSTYEYPVDPNVPLSAVAQGFGEGQNGIKAGVAKFNFIAPAEAAKYREAATKILTELSPAK